MTHSVSSRRLVSFVIPVYNEEENVPLIARAIATTMESLPAYDYEIIFVNDGSRDRTLQVIARCAEDNPRVRGIDFSRNFGKEIATSAGCAAARGDAVITLDADLQHPPDVARKLIAKWENGAEVVYTVRKETQGVSLCKRCSSAIYYWIFRRMTTVEMEAHSTDFRLLDRKVVDVFKTMPERERIYRGMIDWMGFRRDRVEFIAPPRTHGYVAYSYKKLFNLAVNSLTAFSLLPLKFAGVLGIIITTISGILLTTMLITRWFFNETTFTPLAILATTNTFLIGIVLISLGFIALYIARIHDEVVGRPLYIVRETINMPSEEKDSMRER